MLRFKQSSLQSGEGSGDKTPGFKKTMTSQLYPTCIHDAFRKLKAIVNSLPTGDERDDKQWQHKTNTMVADIEELLGRNLFRVGFLAASQCGKSTTVNNLLGGPVLPEGKSGTCSSVRVRLRRSLDASYHVRLRYYSRNKFRDWRDVVGVILGFFESGCGHSYQDSDLIASINKKRQQPDLAESTQELCDYYERLLNSASQFNSIFVEDDPSQSKVVSEQFRDVSEVRQLLEQAAQHPSKSERTIPTEYTLLEEIELELPHKRMHPNLELIDLPGLGTTKKQDELGTMQFLRELDGAFLLEKANGNLSSNQAFEDFVTTLRKNDRNFSERIWLLLTYFEGLAEHLIHGDGTGGKGDSTLFDTIVVLLATLKLPHDRILMLANDYHKKLREANGNAVKVDQQLVRLHLGKDHQGGIDYPAKLKQHPGLLGAFKDMVDDGGIDRLRKCIEQELYSSIRVSRIASVTKQINELSQRVANRISTFEAAARFDGGTRDQRQQWLSSVFSVLGALTGTSNKNDSLVSQLKARLDDDLKGMAEIAKANTQHLHDGHETLTENFERLSKTLQQVGQETLVTSRQGSLSHSLALVESSLTEEARQRNLNTDDNSPLGLFKAKALALIDDPPPQIRRPCLHLADWSVPDENGPLKLPVDQYITVIDRVVARTVYETHLRIHYLIADQLCDLRFAIKSLDEQQQGRPESTAEWLENSRSQMQSIQGLLHQPIESVDDVVSVDDDFEHDITSSGNDEDGPLTPKW
ncbi:MAG TPA: hypothetical protein DDZ51_04250 [Planctomycetaceae bacterium]|nr:hypothetical protein [Planctomycetaceae bacterium]